MSNLHFPLFNREEWGFINPDLAIVRLANGLRTSDANIRALTLLKQQLLMKASTEISSIATIVLEEAKRASGTDRDADRRCAYLKSLIDRYKYIKSRTYSSPGRTESLNDIIQNAVTHYQAFNVELFREDLSRLVEESNPGDDSIKKQIARTNGKLGIETRNRNELLDAVPSTCRGGDIPHEFRGRRLVPSEDGTITAQQRREMSEHILNCFLTTWRDRVQLFTVPVSITGVGIHTMPARRRGVWREAFDTLGLSDYVGRRAYFHWLNSDESDLEGGDDSSRFVNREVLVGDNEEE